MVLVVAALYSLARQYRTDSGETAADILHRKVDFVVNSISPTSRHSREASGKQVVVEEESNPFQEEKKEDDDDEERTDIATATATATTIFPMANPFDKNGTTTLGGGCHRSTTEVTTTTTITTGEIVVEPSPEVRQEWINAVFGKSYCQPNDVASQQPQEKFGLARIPEPFTSYSVRIPPVADSEEKLGITVSKLPLGLRVHKVQKHSEADYLGVEEGSVLVYINGMSLLAEPTKLALERMWQYEGFLENDSSTNSPQSEFEEATSPTSNDLEEGNKSVRDPVTMTFIKKGKLSTVLILCNPPWGITWASCGNFPLVKRVYSYAASAGVQRGSIVASAQEESFRTCDHADMASILRDVYAKKQEIRLTLCFPPAASRSSHFKRKTGQEDIIGSAPEKPAPQRVKRTDDGVEIRFHSLENAIGGLWQATSPTDHNSNGCIIGDRKSICQLADEVASGVTESPVLRKGARDQVWTSHKIYSPCPKLNKDELLDAWNPLQALLYCLQFHCVAYREEDFSDFLRTFSAGAPKSTVHSFRDLLSGPGSPDAAGSFLLQIISVICSPSNYRESCVSEEKKEATAPVSTPTMEAQRDAKELTSLLLKVSQRDEGFCQRLYFLLRSYISSLETKRPTSTKGDGGPNSLLALLNCLELLRYAEKQLAGQIQEFNGPKAIPTMRASGVSNEALFPSPMPSPIPASPSSTSSTVEAAPKASTTSKKKGIIGFLRKRPQRSSSVSSSKHSVDTDADSVQPSPSREESMSDSRSSSLSRRSLTRVSSAPLSSLNQKGRRNQLPSRPPTTVTKSASAPADDRVTIVATATSASLRIENEASRSSSSGDMDVLAQTPSTMYENMAEFLSQLDRICGTIERNLQKSFRQKVADWARQPWSATKDTAVANVTTTMRENLEQATAESGGRLLVNPVESSELLSSVDTNECYIIPSAHFPLLLTFNISEKRSSDDPMGMQRIYRTTVELLTLRGSERLRSSAYVVHAGVAGTVVASDNSLCIDTSGAKQSWFSGQKLLFDTRSSWGAPQTLSLRLSSASEDSSSEPPRFGWVDLSDLWAQHDEDHDLEDNRGDIGTMTTTTKLILLESSENNFDDQGELPNIATWESLDLELKVTTEFVEFDEDAKGAFARKRMLLYKHDDDLRQEAFAVQFIRTCDKILKAAGLDMKLLTFQCTPVGTKRGFVEWVPGSVPLSEICQPFFESFWDNTTNSDSAQTSLSMFAKAGLTKFESLTRMGNSQGSISRLTGSGQGSGSGFRNPIQDYLRSVAYDADAPYLVRRSVMDIYVKSCAGYTVITYILGVGDRHLDNLLLHQSGNFFHCDFSFLLGRDPKAFQPVRVTDDMVQGMGGKESDNYAKFLSLASAAFLALRRPETVRVLLSLVRLMEASTIPDITETQPIDQAIMGMRERLRLDLSDDQAVVFMEDLIERAVSSRMWLAVDAMHSLGKKF
ncbi:hypothetical protein ACA910_009220 [Epithemia clementina (nom. ined.)]